MAELNKTKARQLTLYRFHAAGEVIFEAEKYGHFGEFLPHAYFLFFLISNKDIYSRTLPYAENHKAERKVQRERERKKKKERKGN